MFVKSLFYVFSKFYLEANAFCLFFSFVFWSAQIAWKCVIFVSMYFLLNLVFAAFTSSSTLYLSIPSLCLFVKYFLTNNHILVSYQHISECKSYVKKEIFDYSVYSPLENGGN